jgi:hypothetical protein
MKISLSDFLVLIDTLGGSLSISDGGNLFKYSKGTREALWQALHDRGSEVVAVVDGEPPVEPIKKED